MENLDIIKKEIIENINKLQSEYKFDFSKQQEIPITYTEKVESVYITINMR